MAHGLPKRGVTRCRAEGKTGVGSRRIFSPQFKLQVLDSYRGDADCKGNQRATARKYGIHRRQIQKWLQVENALRSGVKQQSKSAAASLNVDRQPDDDESRVPAHAEPSSGWQRNVAPLDLSFKRRESDTPTAATSLGVALPSPQPPPPPPPLAYQPDVWDLSTKPLRPPVKLFKPYLDVEEEAAPPPPPPRSPQPVYLCQQVYYVNDNNNYDAYTLHELQPKSYYYRHHQPYYPECCAYEETPLKQRQSYSLDFKLSAIDCYYRDAACRGNQRAVAAKYNVHRRQVQKWLKQADELKSRNEVLQHSHAVR
ncbi:uncharacterized protein LOC132702192 [Cylas formicarius]|uniref:uncharacterized protein LOC132702192 n=1 Tax=Cylas formicarius TaxID=197179 RepID=UPI00295892B4|nr:uncharacterized protein LOC132702192 [Cylas formicarius]